MGNYMVTLLGPRQIGKTTLAKQLKKHINKEVIYLDLQNHEDLELLKKQQFFLKTI